MAFYTEIYRVSFIVFQVHALYVVNTLPNAQDG
jgi:hypothetical protein